MKKSPFIFLIVLVLLLTGKMHWLNAQDIAVDTDEIESLIDEWNFANNGRNLESFRRVYDEKVLFYTEDVSQTRAIELKRQLFSLKPDFRQRITTTVSYTPYTSGIIKCDFIKDVFEKTSWRKDSAYLLVSYESGRYRIVGEGDVATDRVLGYKLDIGTPIIFQDNSRTADAIADTSTLTKGPERVFDSVRSFLRAEGVDVVLPDVSTLGVVTVPKGYVYILIGLLSLGGLMIFIADSAQARKRKLNKASFAAPDEAERVVNDFKMQSVFETFVITLFDPLHFQHKRPKQERVYAGKGGTAPATPDLIFEFRQNESELHFGILCRYYRSVLKNEIQLSPREIHNDLKQLQQELDLYYVLGFGGTPDDPKELYFVPASDVKGEYIRKSSLRPYSKSGMFYYSRKTGRIQ